MYNNQRDWRLRLTDIQSLLSDIRELIESHPPETDCN